MPDEIIKKPKRVNDWPEFFIQYHHAREFNNALSIRRWALDNGLVPNDCHREFKALRTEISEATSQQLDLAAPKAIGILRILAETSTDERIKLSAADKLAALWVQKEKINLSINTTGPVNVGISMFPREDKDLALKMLEGSNEVARQKEDEPHV